MKRKLYFVIFVLVVTCLFYFYRIKQVEIVGAKNDLIVYKRNFNGTNFEIKRRKLFWEWLDLFPNTETITYGIMNKKGEVIYQNIDYLKFGSVNNFV